MGRTPSNPLAKLQYFEDHIAPFTANAVAIGTTAATVTLLSTKTTAARSAYNAQQVARQAAENATQAFRDAVAAMNVVGQGILKQVDTTAEQTSNPNVYTLAQVTPPSGRTPRGEPGTPFGFKVEIGNIGELILKWKNSNASGCVYNIYRRLGNTGDFQTLGGVGRKTFTDDTVPAGTTQVQYQIQAVRSTGVSQYGVFTVNLGIEPGMVSVMENTPARIAA